MQTHQGWIVLPRFYDRRRICWFNVIIFYVRAYMRVSSSIQFFKIRCRIEKVYNLHAPFVIYFVTSDISVSNHPLNHIIYEWYEHKKSCKAKKNCFVFFLLFSLTSKWKQWKNWRNILYLKVVVSEYKWEKKILHWILTLLSIATFNYSIR